MTDKTPHEEALEAAPADYVKSFLQVLNDNGTKRILIEGETWSASYGTDAIPAIQAAIAAYTERMPGQVSVKPLDFSNVLRHAFLSGVTAARRISPGDECDGPALWAVYEPYEPGSYSRIRSALTATPPASAEPVAYIVPEHLQRLKDGESVVLYARDRDKIGISLYTSTPPAQGVSEALPQGTLGKQDKTVSIYFDTTDDAQTAYDILEAALSLAAPASEKEPSK